jgi:hypothetical protein
MRELSESSVRQALIMSRVYVSHDWLCDPTGFAFLIEKNGNRVGVMGDELRFEKGLRLRLAAPTAGIIRLSRNGNAIREIKSDSLDFDVTESGIYRAEVWLEIDGEERPWIYANPIRVM